MTTERRSLCAKYEPQFREFYKKVDPDHVYVKARQATETKIVREHFTFPGFSAWVMEQRQPQE